MMRRAGTCSALLLLGACGGGNPDLEYPPAPPKIAAAEVSAARRPPLGALYRDQVVAAVDRGLGVFLGHVVVEPSLEQGRFAGFRIVELRPDEYWEGIDLRPGDVVETVNGQPIERETQAYAVFQSLRTAAELRVQLLRDERRRELRLPILERRRPPSPGTVATSPPPKAANATPPPKAASATPPPKAASATPPPKAANVPHGDSTAVRSKPE